MSVRIRIGEDDWLTGEPDQRQTAVTSAGGVQFAARQNMTVQAGPNWPAQRPIDLLQRGVILSFWVTRTFADVAATVTWLADLLSVEPSLPMQEDVIIRWEHHDEIGYTESRLPWGALRFDSIAHDGPETLRLRISVMASEMEDHAVYAPGHILSEAGPRILWEDGTPLRLESDDYTLTTNP